MHRARGLEVILDANALSAMTDGDSRIGQMLNRASTAEQYAEIRYELKRRGRPIPGNDLWIAALGRQHHLPLLSRDEHFDFVPKLKRIRW